VKLDISKNRFFAVFSNLDLGSVPSEDKKEKYYWITAVIFVGRDVLILSNLYFYAKQATFAM
jgi:hypothetical protein